MSACRSCGAGIVWAVTTSGKRMPLDADPTPAGNVQTTVEPPHDVLRAEVLGPLEVELLDPDARAGLRMPHHATCPHADDWRR